MEKTIAESKKQLLKLDIQNARALLGFMEQDEVRAIFAKWNNKKINKRFFDALNDIAQAETPRRFYFTLDDRYATLKPAFKVCFYERSISNGGYCEYTDWGYADATFTQDNKVFSVDVIEYLKTYMESVINNRETFLAQADECEKDFNKIVDAVREFKNKYGFLARECGLDVNNIY